MLRNRSGYTLTEMILVLIIFGVVTSLSIPRLHAAQSSAGLRSARQQTAVYLAQAHALAVQRGKEARFVRNGNSVTVTVDSSGTQVVYSRASENELPAPAGQHRGAAEKWMEEVAPDNKEDREKPDLQEPAARGTSGSRAPR